MDIVYIVTRDGQYITSTLDDEMAKEWASGGSVVMEVELTDLAYEYFLSRQKHLNGETGQ